jgi:hypothetical protein
MEFLFWNIRGMNALYKQVEVINILNSNKYSLVGILENKLSNLSIENFINKIDKKWKFSHNITEEQRCRIIIFWDSMIWNNIIIHTSEQYITSMLYSDSNINLMCTIVYAFNEEEKRKPLWDYIIDLSKNVNLPWLVAGDFNSILFSGDRLNNGSFNSVGDNNFIECINFSQLVEPAFTGNFFTWRGGISFSVHSKIDRVFVNSIWLDKFDNFGICFGNHSLSDHTQILINIQMQNKRKRQIPFKYKNSWHKYDDYHQVIYEPLEKRNTGNPLYKLICKLKAVKNILKKWSSNLTNMTAMFNKLKDQNNNIYNQLINNPFDKSLLLSYSNNYNCLHKLTRKLAIDNDQKMKMNWLTKGDRPTEFFYSKISECKSNRRFNFTVNNEGKWISTSETIAEEAICYFSDLFHLPQAISQFPNIICKKILTENAKSSLCSPFQLEEIREAVFQINENSSPGPDGFNSKFYKVHWDNIKMDIWEAMNGILHSGKLIKEINHTFLCLIPKNPEASTIAEFRPISLCNVTYKILANLLCNRMKAYMNDLISHNQNAFIPNRSISENSLLAYEMVRSFNRKNSNNVCMKIDLHKAYDKINREFIHHMLISMGFPLTFANLIYECISTPYFSILIEGTPYGLINSSRGIRQGDPLSPYLFAITMEFLSLNMEVEFIKGNLSPIYQVEPIITHLLYADDILILAKATTNNAETIQQILQRVTNFTGLDINSGKSSVFFSKGAKCKQKIVDIIKIKPDNLPIKYLGIPLSNNTLKARDFGLLIDKINKKFSNWHNRFLNISGRVELIKSVIQPMLHFWLQIAQIPASIIQKINSLCANFLWKSKSHKMSWDEVCKTKNEGGLGIRKIEDIAKSIAAKLLWNYINGDSLWAQWMHNKYGNKGNFWVIRIDNNASHTWKTILHARQWCKGHIDRKIVNGENTDIWFDPWIQGSNLIDSYGWNTMRIMDGCHKAVSSLITNHSWKHRLNFIPINSHAEIRKIHIHQDMEHDFWWWLPTKQGQFSLKSAWSIFRTKHTEFEWSTVVWDKSCAPKMSTCAMLAIRDKLQTKYKISKWLPNIDKKCVLCSNQMEDINHLFFQCSYSRQVLDALLPKLNIQLNTNYDINSLLNSILQAQNKMKSPIKSIFNIFFTTIIWNIWGERNNRVFKGLEQPFQLRINQIILESKQLLQVKFQEHSVNEEEKLIISKLDPGLKLQDCFRPP